MSDEPMTVEQLCNKATPVISSGCDCYGDHCTGTCGGGQPLGWSLDPETIRAAHRAEMQRLTRLLERVRAQYAALATRVAELEAELETAEQRGYADRVAAEHAMLADGISDYDQGYRDALEHRGEDMSAYGLGLRRGREQAARRLGVLEGSATWRLMTAPAGPEPATGLPPATAEALSDAEHQAWEAAVLESRPSAPDGQQ